MKALSISLAFLVSVSIQAQDLLQQEFHENGKVARTVYEAGDATYFIAYHENGKVSEMGTFKNGKRTGEWRKYNAHGDLIARAYFKKDLRVGQWEFFHDNGHHAGMLHFDAGVYRYGEQRDEQGELIAFAER